ncbi:hypothetical protein PIB30_055835 [Stylosanthes scabra]|uniref:Uncharacterized protein n=1 Tax=Stylosanthes scabra TaxID=79078 RepID=A0ABU6XJ17_9FABA|nr:hypothetical protein [Stylosanthes scabra]
MTGAASPHKDHARGTGQSRKAIRPIPLLAQWQFLDHTRFATAAWHKCLGTWIVPVTAGYSWELGAESRTPSNTCSNVSRTRYCGFVATQLVGFGYSGGSS